MASNYSKYFRHRSYSFSDIYSHLMEIKNQYADVSIKIKRGRYELLIKLQPTDGSPVYKVKVVAREWKSSVDIFVVEPNLAEMAGEHKIPHIYKNGSLCLFYPKNKEWSFDDNWGKTLIPWTCLWLYYFEIWYETGEWMGGGIHPGIAA